MCTSRLKETICAVLCGIDRGLIPSQHCIFSLKRLFLSIGWTGKQGKCSPERSKCCLNSEITTDRFAQLIRLLPDLCSVCTRTPESALAMTPNPPFLLLLVPERNKKTIKKKHSLQSSFSPIKDYPAPQPQSQQSYCCEYLFSLYSVFSRRTVK